MAREALFGSVICGERWALEGDCQWEFARCDVLNLNLGVFKLAFLWFLDP